MTEGAPPIRSALFVPAHRADFLAKVDRSGADAVIVDLEDSVHQDRREDARRSLTSWLAQRDASMRPLTLVRINPIESGCLLADLEAAVAPATTAIVVPKVTGPSDVRTVDGAISHAEGARGIRQGTVRLWPLFESANAVLAADAIVRASRRVAYAGGGFAEGGDLARDVGFQTTADGNETLFLRSFLLLVARAAGVSNPMTGMHTAIEDLQGLRRLAESSRAIGYEGMMVIHPSHVATVNEVFKPSAEQLAHARAVIEGLGHAAGHGDGAVIVDGQMVDVTMAETARKLLARAALLDGGAR